LLVSYSDIRTIIALAFQNYSQGEARLKEWKCVEIGHHKNIAEAIGEYQRKGWRLNTYQATGQATLVSHYLLFEKGN